MHCRYSTGTWGVSRLPRHRAGAAQQRENPAPEPNGLEQSDSSMVVTGLVPGGRVTLGGAGGAKARSGRSERQRSDHARERMPCGTGGRPGTYRRRVPDTARTSIHDPPSGWPAISASAYTSCQPALADSIPCNASSLSSPKSRSAVAPTAALRNSRKRSPTDSTYIVGIPRPSRGPTPSTIISEPSTLVAK